MQAAADALTGGEVVALMPQGTIPRGPAFFDPVLTGRWGAARLAQMTRAPVIPVGLWGTEQVWPRSARVPNVLNVTDPPTVRVRVGAPVELKYRSLDADTKRIMRAISDLLPPEAHQHHDPTPEELARTFPPGYRGEPEPSTAVAPAPTDVTLGARHQVSHGGGRHLSECSNGPVADPRLTSNPIAVPEADLDDLRERLARTRWPEPETVDDWSQGIPLAYVQEVCATGGTTTTGDAARPS